MITKRLEQWLAGRRLWMILAGASAVWFVFVAVMTILRYRLNYASAYDFGIFSQMFYYMDKCLEPLTTCERDGLLSHFAVHLSPIFYVLLPFYHLFPRPETLLVLQALAVASGIIPVCLLGKALGFSRVRLLVFGLMYCAYPAFMGGCFYDFHENKFLTVIILWTLYFLETGRFKSMLVCVALILAVKEDAPVYAACIGLYLFLRKKRYGYGAAVFLGSCLYFCLAIWYINRFGDGAMVNRFDNFISNKQLGLISMFKTVLVNPAYVLSQIASGSKLLFLAQMLLPLGFLPLMTGDWRKWTLLIPFVLINLMSNYQYQHSIYFQYTYGTGALLFYLGMVNFRDLTSDRRTRKMWKWLPWREMALCGLICGIALLGVVAGQKEKYVGLYRKYGDKAQMARELLAGIPQEAAVKASVFFVPQLSMRDQIYLLDSRHDGDYAVVDLRPGYEKNVRGMVGELEEEGYVREGEVEGYVLVMREGGAEGGADVGGMVEGKGGRRGGEDRGGVGSWLRREWN